MASEKSWVDRLPRQIACLLLAATLVLSQCFPSDTVLSVANGETLLFCVLCFAMSVLTALDALIELRTSAVCVWDRRWLVILAICSLGIAWLWLSTWLQIGRQNVRFAYNGCWQWTAQILLFLCVARLAQCSKTTKTIFCLMLSLAAGTIASAMYQYFVAMPRVRNKFANDPAAILAEVGIEPGTAEAMLYANRLASPEPLGPFALTNSFAGFLIVWLVVWICTSLLSTMQQKQARAIDNDSSKALARTWPFSWLWQFVVMLGMGWMLLLTNSRTAWLAFLLCMTAVLFGEPTFRLRFQQWFARRPRIAVGIAFMLLVAVGAVLMIRPTIASDAWKSLTYRMEYWQGALSMVNESPWFGDGACNFQSGYNRVKPMAASESPADPHNFLMETLCAGGYPLLIILILFLAYAAYQGVHWSSASDCNSESIQRTHLKWSVLSFQPTLLIGALLTSLSLMLVYLAASGSDQAMAVGLMLIATGLSMYALRHSDLVGYWVSHPVLIGLSLLVLIIHLLASGGWMLPGVMNSGCVLAAIALGNSVVREDAATLAPKSRTMQSSAVAMYVGLVTLAAYGFVTTTLRPVLSKSEQINAMQLDAGAPREIEQWIAIMNCDVFDSELCRLVAMPCVQTLSQRGMTDSKRNEWNRLFEQTSKARVFRDPQNWVAAADCGRWNAMIADALRRSSSLSIAETDDLTIKINQANAMFQIAAKLYPHSVATNLQAAVGAAWADQIDLAQEFLSKAEEIDRATPHLDRKIAQATVFFPVGLERIGGGDAGIERQISDPGMVKGEPAVRWLRMQTQSGANR
jgi:O-antigen ligase